MSDDLRAVQLDAKTVSLAVRPDGVGILTYDVPGETMNTLTAETGNDLGAALLAIESDPLIKAVVLTSGKVDCFVAGADIDMLKAVNTTAEAAQLSRDAQVGFERLASFKKPVVAAVDGACLGGGFELALACHARVASTNPKTIFALPEVQLGLLPGADGLQRVAALVGLPDALDIGLTGKNLRAAKAKKMGLVDEVCPPSILVEAACARALKLAKKSPKKKARLRLDSKGLQTFALEKNPVGRSLVFKQTRKAAFKKSQGHYPAIDAIIKVLEVYASKGLEASRETEATLFGELVVSEVAANLMSIFFATTALKKDSGVDSDAKARKVNKVGMLGAGLMGAGITYVTVQAGIPVRLKDRDNDGLGRGFKYVSDIYASRVKRRSMTKMDHAHKMAMVTGTTDYSGLQQAEVVIEAVFEDLNLKHQIVADVEGATGPNTIFASNTSSLPIGKIAAAAKRPENVIGMHYFSPVHKMPLLEVIRTKQTSDEVVATAVALGKRQGKIVIVVNDGVGFYTSRVLGPLMNEAAYLLAEGVPVEEIDAAMIRWGWPVGPMALLDEVGIDVAAHVGPIMVEALGDRMAPPPIMAKLVDDNRKGRKNERGIYLYGDAAKKAKKDSKKLFGKRIKGKPVDTSVYKLLGITPKPGKVSAEEIQARCSLQFINEAMHCYGDGILRSARDGDVGAIFGLGFPPFRGGPFRYVDHVGAAEVVSRIQAFEDRFGQRWSPAPVLLEMAKKNKRFRD